MMRCVISLTILVLYFTSVAHAGSAIAHKVDTRSSLSNSTGEHEPIRRMPPIHRRHRQAKRACVANSNSNAAINNVGNTGNSAYSVTSSAKIAGLAWNNSPDDTMANFAGDQVTWFYTWSPWYVGSGLQAGLNFVPMLWSAKQLSDFNSNAPSFKSNGVTHILGFNEPNEPGQANMVPSDAASLWNSALIPMRNQGFKLVSPACSSAPNSIEWYTEFLGQLSTSQHPDAIAVHYYGTSAAEMISYLENLYSLFGIPIWLTEYACENFSGVGGQCSEDEVYSFMSTALMFLNHTPWIERHSWFGALRDMAGVNDFDCLWASRNVGDPTLSSIGWLYAYGNV